MKRWFEETLGKLSRKSDTTKEFATRWDDGATWRSTIMLRNAPTQLFWGAKIICSQVRMLGRTCSGALGLIKTAKLNGLNTEAYLREVLRRIAAELAKDSSRDAPSTN